MQRYLAVGLALFGAAMIAGVGVRLYALDPKLLGTLAAGVIALALSWAVDRSVLRDGFRRPTAAADDNPSV